MSDAFDPFSIEDDDYEESSYQEQRPLHDNDESVMFDNKAFRQNDVVPKRQSILLHSPVTKLNTSIDSDIYSHLFASPPRTSHSQSNVSVSGRRDRKEDPMNTSSSSSSSSPFSSNMPSSFKPSSTNVIPINILLQEQMSAMYDSVPNSSPVMDLKGTINIKASTMIGGHTFYISFRDTERHLKQITTFFDIAKEVTDHSKEVDPFVKKHQEQGDRIFKVSIPTHVDSLGSKAVNVIKYVGSDYLRPIPLLVNVKVRVVGDICRVGVKIRSNPIHTHNLGNLVILIAVPPDASGESAKMSRQGGVWDPIKRVIVYKYEKIECGETVDLQMQFDYVPSIRKDGQNAMLPRFPVLVRCNSMNESLSNVQLDVGGGDGRVVFEMHLDKNFQLFHRKI